MPRTFVGARLRATAVTAALAAGTLVGTAVASAPAASASTPSAAQVRAAKINRVMSWAAHERGKPYRYGAAGPSAFDCSGLVQYVFKHAIGKSLPHNAAAQYRASQHISHRSLRPGDLVFVRYGGGISHVGIYAGNGYWWVAPHSGTRVQKQRIYHASFVYGRIIK